MPGESMKHARIAAEVFNRPHMIEPGYGRTFVSALSRHGFNIRSLADAEGVQFDAAQMDALAQSFNRGERKLFAQADNVAIIPIEGTLAHRYGSLDPSSGMTGYDGIQAKLEAALADDTIDGIVLDINSPGGAVAGCFDLADQIYAARDRKPIWAVCDELACSAAYSLASAATRIVAPRTAQIGSIGVLTMHADQSRMLDEIGVDVTFIFAGDHKVDGNAFEPLPEDVRANIQSDIDDVYAMFTETVGRNRPALGQQGAIDTQARVYSAGDAQAAGLIDDIMPTHQVLDAFQATLVGSRPPQSPTRGAKTMALSLFGLKPAAKGPAADRETDTIDALTAAGFAVSATDNGTSVAGLAVAADADTIDLAALMTAREAGEISDEQVAAVLPAVADRVTGEQRYTEAQAREAFAPADNSASLDALVNLCAEHKLDALAKPLHARGVTAEQADAIMADVAGIRDKMAATFPDDRETAARLADQFATAAHAASTPQFADALGALMVEACAVMSGAEVDHHPPADNGRSANRANFNVAARYKR